MLQNYKASMKIYPVFLTALFSLAALSTYAEMPAPVQQEPNELIVFNRIVAKVNGKTISVLDVMKKMDMFLQKNYPQFADSKAARYQFFSSQWRDTLAQMVDQELMIADAEKLEVKVTDAEVREEVLNRFGPNIMPNLEKIGVTYEEARKMIHEEMIVERMRWFRVNSKAMSTVNSLDVKEAYKQYCAKNPEMEQWEYQVLSLRAAEKETSEALAKRATELLQNNTDLSAIAEQLKTSNDDATITLSPEVQADEKSVSVQHKEVLKTLADNSFSAPVAQVSRSDNSVVYRIFHLKKHSRRELPPFEKMAEQLKDDLLMQSASKLNTQYLVKLRERLGYDEKHMLETLPQDFQPFAIR
ncbi:MAG: SurA N-terminal domain-containing protein [Candidatus Melainabacteria bacterium]|nr:SurA N-terminal domain-containing protein [Candidatus Melainabacteria bacterium]